MLRVDGLLGCRHVISDGNLPEILIGDGYVRKPFGEERSVADLKKRRRGNKKNHYRIFILAVNGRISDTEYNAQKTNVVIHTIRVYLIIFLWLSSSSYLQPKIML